MIRNKCRMMFSGSGNLLGECGIMDLGHKYNFSNVAVGKHHRYTETYSCNYVKKLGHFSVGHFGNVSLVKASHLCALFPIRVFIQPDIYRTIQMYSNEYLNTSTPNNVNKNTLLPWQNANLRARKENFLKVISNYPVNFSLSGEELSYIVYISSSYLSNYNLHVFFLIEVD